MSHVGHYVDLAELKQFKAFGPLAIHPNDLVTKILKDGEGEEGDSSYDCSDSEEEFSDSD